MTSKIRILTLMLKFSQNLDMGQKGLTVKVLVAEYCYLIGVINIKLSSLLLDFIDFKVKCSNIIVHILYSTLLSLNCIFLVNIN